MELWQALEQIEARQAGRLACKWAASAELTDAGVQIIQAAERALDGRAGSLDDLTGRLRDHGAGHEAWCAAGSWVRRTLINNFPAPRRAQVKRAGVLAGISDDDMWADVIAVAAGGYTGDQRVLDCAHRLAPGWDGTLSGLLVAAQLVTNGRSGPCV